MKSEGEIRRQLEEVYGHRLSIRIERYTKPCCRNCVRGVSREFDLGDFGTISKWGCRDERKCGDGCGFECRWTPEQIESRMLEDISDPSVCGTKEPKIAALLWVLHKGGECGYGGDEKSSSGLPDSVSDGAFSSFWQRIRGMFE